MPAGIKSEVLVIADETTLIFTTGDLLSQAEHGIDSRVIFLDDFKEI